MGKGVWGWKGWQKTLRLGAARRAEGRHPPGALGAGRGGHADDGGPSWYGVAWVAMGLVTLSIRFRMRCASPHRGILRALCKATPSGLRRSWAFTQGGALGWPRLLFQSKEWASAGRAGALRALPRLQICKRR